jgi:hypothetical protein
MLNGGYKRFPFTSRVEPLGFYEAPKVGIECH